jgi:glycosyltransferase involved in cell wall biosynthesis
MKKVMLFLSLFSALFIGHFGPKAWKLCFKESQDEKTFPIIEQKPFVIVIPSYNNEKWCERNLRSVFEQKYDNYRIIYVDDCSTDATEQKARAFIEKSGKSSRVQFIRNTTNLGAMANLYYTIHSCLDDEIVVTLDGDDWFSHDKVLFRLNQIYADSDVWLTYGSHIEYPSYQRSGWAKLLPPKVVKENKFRQHRWCTSQLRTFYAGLFKKVQLQDLLYEGEFYKTTYDLACMFPMLEMAGFHSRYVKDILYVYNRVNPLNDDKIRWEYQQKLERYIRALPTYPKLVALENKSFVKR